MSAINPRFSILLPTHNRADVVGLAIASVLAQTESDFELLIVADGCTDSTCDVIANFKDSRIRLFDLPKAPHFGYANRNIALRESRGRLIAYVAHDDLLLPDHLELMGNLLDSSKASWGYSRPLWVSTDGIIVPFCTNLNLTDEREDFLERFNTIPAICVVHNRTVFEDSGFWPENLAFAADWELWKQIIKSSRAPPAFLRQPTTLHFSADWKCSRHASMKEMDTLLSIADHAEWWPRILRYLPKVEKHSLIVPEQVLLWNALRSGKGSWVAALRAAIDAVIDRIAWMAVRELIPEHKAMRRSTSWRLTKPLRAIAKGLRNLFYSN
ncbi:MAG: glycosyltransferase family 2 protein [Parachlamydiaceae bacterium]